MNWKDSFNGPQLWKKNAWSLDLNIDICGKVMHRKTQRSDIHLSSHCHMMTICGVTNSISSESEGEEKNLQSSCVNCISDAHKSRHLRTYLYTNSNWFQKQCLIQKNHSIKILLKIFYTQHAAQLSLISQRRYHPDTMPRKVSRYERMLSLLHSLHRCDKHYCQSRLWMDQWKISYTVFTAFK